MISNQKNYPARVLITLFLVILAITGCGRGEEGKIDLSGLLIRQNEMPPYWPISEFSEVGIDKDRTRDSVAISFNSDSYPDTFSIMQNIYRFDSIPDASRDYKKEVDYYKRYYSGPPEWKYSSSVSSASYISCKEERFRICVWIARYNNIVIDLQAPIIPGRMSMGDLEKIVREIDLRAGKLILNVP